MNVLQYLCSSDFNSSFKLGNLIPSPTSLFEAGYLPVYCIFFRVTLKKPFICPFFSFVFLFFFLLSWYLPYFWFSCFSLYLFSHRFLRSGPKAPHPITLLQKKAPSESGIQSWFLVTIFQVSPNRAHLSKGPRGSHVDQQTKIMGPLLEKFSFR